jgi:hypothetical protein
MMAAAEAKHEAQKENAANRSELNLKVSLVSPHIDVTLLFSCPSEEC